MAATITIHATKPSDKVFFPKSSDANHALVQSFNQWTAEQPGFVSQVTTSPTDDTRLQTIVWDTLENYIVWDAARVNRPEFIARASYNNANGITSVLSEIIS
jgi:heme-degrading monooxygenase HmoA